MIHPVKSVIHTTDDHIKAPMALSTGIQPHFTTIAELISSFLDVIAKHFQHVLTICDEAGLIGKEVQSNIKAIDI